MTQLDQRDRDDQVPSPGDREEEVPPSGGGEEVAETFDRSVHEGEQRLRRGWPALLATGAVGGIDLGLGVLALFTVQHATGNELLAALAFGIGFLALTLANSELFTENFLVPVAAVAAGHAPARAVGRLWAGTLVMNLVGGWVFMALVMLALPSLHGTAIEMGRHYVELGLGLVPFAAAVLGGAAITLVTWMQNSTESIPAKLVAAWAGAFLLAAPPLNHSIVGSLEMFAALHVGAPFGYADWAGALLMAVLGNALGGVGLVTVLRLVQVGGAKVQQERARA